MKTGIVLSCWMLLCSGEYAGCLAHSITNSSNLRIHLFFTLILQIRGMRSGAEPAWRGHTVGKLQNQDPTQVSGLKVRSCSLLNTHNVNILREEKEGKMKDMVLLF